jgi:hypothetical protein
VCARGSDFPETGSQLSTVRGLVIDSTTAHLI